MTRIVILATLLGWLGLCAAAPDAAPQEITWDDLMPADYQPDKLFGDADLSTLEDGDPRAAELMQKLQDLWKNAPVVQSLDGTDVRLPGFAIPLESDTKTAKSFILVPYYGACIHVPPPPSNQIVLVRSPQGAPIKEAFDMVWVTGRLRVEAQQTDVAHAGYTLDASLVEPYEEE